MNLFKGLSVSLLVLAAGSVSAGEFYQNGPTATLTQNGIEQGLATNVNFPPTYNGTAGQFTGTFGSGPDAFLRFFCFEYQAAGGPAAYTSCFCKSSMSSRTDSCTQPRRPRHSPDGSESTGT